MRRFIFILMIALLPLHGWMGEAMATEMAAMHLIATQAVKTPSSADFKVIKSLGSMSSMNNCDMQRMQASEPSFDESSAKSSCTDCQACHATGWLNSVQVMSLDEVRYAQPLTPSRQYASASLALSQKPPIL